MDKMSVCSGETARELVKKKKKKKKSQNKLRVCI